MIIYMIYYLLYDYVSIRFHEQYYNIIVYILIGNPKKIGHYCIIIITIYII